MEKISFEYNGKLYQPKVRTSTSKEPHYFWCYLNETDLADEVGNCVMFLGTNGNIKTPHYYHVEHRNLINSIETAIKQQFSFSEKE